MGRKTRSFEVTFEVVWALFAHALANSQVICSHARHNRHLPRPLEFGLKFCLSEGSLENILMEGPLRKQGRWELPPPPHPLSWESITTPGPFIYKSGKCPFGPKKKKQKTKTCQKREQSWGDGSKVSNVNKSVVFHAYLNVALHARPWKIQKILPSKHKNRKTWYVFIKYKKHSKTYLESGNNKCCL